MQSILADFRKAKTAVLTIMEALNFDFRKNFTLENIKSCRNSKIQSQSNDQSGSFRGFKMTKIDWEKNLEIFTLENLAAKL